MSILKSPIATTDEINEQAETVQLLGVHSSAFARHNLSHYDVLILAVAFFLCVAFYPDSVAPSWAPRMIIALAVLPAGLVALGRLALLRDRAALVLVAGLAWAALASSLSPDPLASLRGHIASELSVIVLLSAAGLWALGQGLGDRARELLVPTLLLGLGMNAFVGLLQVVLQIDSGSLAMGSSRANGLTSYSVYFGALMAAGCVLSASRVRVDRKVDASYLLLLVLFAASVSTSGSRAALLAGLVGVAYVGLRRSVGVGVKSLVAFCFGVAVGTALNAIAGASASSVQRLGSNGGDGVRWRLEGWQAGIDAVRERPWNGWGVGRFRQATLTTMPDGHHLSHPWFDAHNVIVEIAVTVGLIGLALFVAFFVLAARRARGPLAAASAVVMLVWLLEPAGLSTLLLVALMTGAATRAAPDSPFQVQPPSRWLWSVALLGGAALGSYLLVSDVRLQNAIASRDPAAIEDAVRPFWRDPFAADLVASQWMLVALESGRPEDGAQAIFWSSRVASYQPTSPRWLHKQAVSQNLFGEREDARTTLERALLLQPRGTETWTLLLNSAIAMEDEQLEERAMDMLCEIGHSSCTR